MNLLPSEIMKTIPALYAQEEMGMNAVAYVKLFLPGTQWTWYVTELCPETRICFGLVVGHCTELGYFSLAELEELTCAGGFVVERDLHFRLIKLSELVLDQLFAS